MSHVSVPVPLPNDASSTTRQEPERPRTAIILAAGNGTRLRRHGGRHAPKPLVEVGGLALLERSILTLHAVGLERIRVVVGAYAEEVEARARALCQERGLAPVELVRCPDYEAGNGASLAAGLVGVEEPVLVTMADHVFSTGFLRRFLVYVAGLPHSPHLATDPQPAQVFDIDDATKVRTADGHIVAIGKELAGYDQVDTGLFYFPSAVVPEVRRAVAGGLTSVSAVVGALVDRGPFAVAPIQGELWQDVDTPAMAREAERRLLRSLVKDTDGVVSRVLNRRLSLAVSRHLARWKVSPNAITTGVTVLSLAAAALAASTDRLYLALGGVLFQLASVLDGCDGEVARLRFSGSRYGAWYDTLSDNVRYVVFYCALGVSSYRGGGGELYLWATALLFLLSSFVIGSMARFVWSTQEHLTNLAVTARFEELSAHSASWWDRGVRALRGLVKQDVQALIAMGLCIAGLPHVYVWLALAGVIATTVTVRRTLCGDTPQAREHGSWRSFRWLLAGSALLGFLLSRMPLSAVGDALASVGPSVLWAFATVPLWYVANALSLSSLTGGRVELRQLFYNQVVGEAYSALLPLAGLGGEPYKIRHLSQWLPVAEASQVVVHDRLVHAMSGPLFTALGLAALAWWVPLPGVGATSLLLLGALFLGVAAVLTLVVFSRVPGRLTGALLRRLPLRTHDMHVVPRERLLASLGCKLLSRALSMVEVWVILRLLGLAADPGQVLAVVTLLSAGSVVFFVVPQGIGVNEASISGAFALLGLAAHLGLAFGLIRRARVVFWALVGLAVHLVLSLGVRVRRLAAAPPS